MLILNPFSSLALGETTSCSQRRKWEIFGGIRAGTQVKPKDCSKACPPYPSISPNNYGGSPAHANGDEREEWSGYDAKAL